MLSRTPCPSILQKRDAMAEQPDPRKLAKQSKAAPTLDDGMTKPEQRKAAPARRPPPRSAAELKSRSAARESDARENVADAAAAEELDGERGPSLISQWLSESPSWLVSLIVHLLILLLLGLWMLPGQVKDLYNLSVLPNEKEAEEELEEIVEEIEELDVDVEQVTDMQPIVETENVQAESMVSDVSDVEAAAVSVELQEFSTETAPKSDLLTSIGSVTGSGLAGRGKAARAALAKQGGGSPESEKAVAMALRWFANHQLPDGGWNYDHRGGLCQGRCSEHGSLAQARNGATAMALLPFLGAGQTHTEGEYKETVGRGLYYLVRNAKLSKKGGSWHESGGSMYSHGLAAIAVCEAYGMTQDPALMAPAQAACAYIVNNQDPVVGGWGYGGPGRDTSVSGWQIMALKSGHMSYLQIPPSAGLGIETFLNFVQADSGASYGYTSPGRGAATTAVGLLCRMYMGWKRDHPALERGMQTIAAAGPSNNLYRDYYAAQFMFQQTGAEGEVWKKWNDAMRDGLVAKQAQTGHEQGSWFLNGGHSEAGGRILCTCFATLILEVYYRHMPIHKEEATEEGFPE